MRELPATAVSFPVRDHADLTVGIQRLRASGVLSEADEVQRAMIVTIVSELATNIVKYAGRGMIRVTRTDQADGVDVDVWAEDHGPGIVDTERALKDHFTTGTSLGLGLPGVRRMSDRFSIESVPGAGTRVHARKRISGRRIESSMRSMPRSGAASRGVERSTPLWDIGLRARPAPGQHDGGDLALAIGLDDGVLLAMIDASGHGSFAKAAAEQVRSRLDRAEASELPKLLQACHESLEGSRGAAVGLLFVSATDRTARYIGVGNTGAARVAGAPWRPISKDGVLGERLPTPFEQSTTLARGDLIVMWTDGVSGLPGALTVRDAFRPAQELADDIVASRGRSHDDAGCIVLRWEP